MPGAYIFHTSHGISGLFQPLFGGLFLIKGVPLLLQILCILGLSSSLGLLLSEKKLNKRILGQWGEILALFTFSFFCLLCLQPWDEIFINLRHSLNWARGLGFYFNASPATPIEGTVDFLIYFALGVLSRIGLPLLESTFIQGWLGSLLCIFVLRRATAAFFPTLRRLVTFFLCSQPILTFNASHGFATTLFAGVALAAVFSSLLERSRNQAWVWLALLPCIRLEGILLSLLLSFHNLRAVPTGERVQRTLKLAWVAIPFALLTLYRWRTYGDWIPTPITYKSTLFSPFYWTLGARNFLADLIAGGGWLGFLTWVLFRKRESSFSTFSRTALLLLLTFTLPYYLSGGDWFPSYWGRYALPLNLLLIWMGFLAWTDSMRSPSPASTLQPHVHLTNYIPVLFLLAQIAWPISGYYKLVEVVFGHRRTLAKIEAPTITRGHYRVQHLSQLGNHLRQTTRSNVVIATSEVATLSYFADRPTLDLLGVANPEIARAPLRETPGLWRAFPKTPELPYLIFKRLKPELVDKHRPEIVYTFDYMVRDLYPEGVHEELSPNDFLRAFSRWERKFTGLIDPLYGGLEHLYQLGYRPMIVVYANQFAGMYFVSNDYLNEHIAELKRQTFQGGWFDKSQP